MANLGAGGESGKSDQPAGIHVDPNGDIFITGYSNNNYAGTSTPDDFNAFISKLNSSGVVQWIKTEGKATSHDYCYESVMDHLGNIYCAGSAFGKVGTLGETSTAGQRDTIIYKWM